MSMIRRETVRARLRPFRDRLKAEGHSQPEGRGRIGMAEFSRAWWACSGEEILEDLQVSLPRGLSPPERLKLQLPWAYTGIRIADMRQTGNQISCP